MRIFKNMLTLVSAMAAEAKMSEEQFLTLSVGRDVVADREAALRVIAARRATEKAAAEKAAAEKKAAAARHAKRDERRNARRAERAQEIVARRAERATADALAAERQVEDLEEVAADAACLSELMGPDKFRASFGKVMRRLHGLKKAWNRNCGREVARLGAWLSPDAAERVYNTLLRREEERAAAARDYSIPGYAALKGFAALAQLVGVRA